MILSGTQGRLWFLRFLQRGILVPNVIIKGPVNLLPTMLPGIGVIGKHAPKGQLTGPLFRNALGTEPVNQVFGWPLVPRKHNPGSVEKQLCLRKQLGRVHIIAIPSCLTVLIPQPVVRATLIKRLRPDVKVILCPGQVPLGANHHDGSQTV